jgi:hypothetical protein
MKGMKDAKPTKAIAAMKKAMRATKYMKEKNKRMKVMNPTKKKAQNPMKKQARKSTVARGKRRKMSVFRGTKNSTTGGLTKDKLMKNRKGKIVSKLASAVARSKYPTGVGRWVKCLSEARANLGLTGFCAVGGKSDEGKRLHAMARTIYDGKATPSSLRGVEYQPKMAKGTEKSKRLQPKRARSASMPRPTAKGVSSSAPRQEAQDASSQDARASGAANADDGLEAELTNGKTLAEGILAEDVPKPDLLLWADWQKWRRSNSRPTRPASGHASYSPFQQRESDLWQVTMQTLHGDGWREALRSNS